MTAAGPWSVKGIEPKAREVAKDLARRSGLTLGEWLNQMIIEGEAEPPPPPVSTHRDGRYRDTEYRAAPSRDYSQPGEPFRAPQNFGDRAKDGEMQRIARALEQLTARIEAAENRSTLAISGIDQSVMGVLSRLEAVERDQGSVAARFDGALEDVRQTQARSADKVRRLGEEDVTRVEAMKALEGALSKVAETLYDGEGKTRASLNQLREDASNLSRRMDRTEAKVESEPASHLIDAVIARIGARLDEAEARTSTAVRALETAFASLDARMLVNDARAAPEAEAASRRFDSLTVELSSKVEAARTEMAEQLKALAGGQLDQIETSLRNLTAQVEQDERRSAQAIDTMGGEVMRIASTLGERVGKVEARSAEVVQQVGGDMARIADAIEQRMGHRDTVQAQALEKLGGEIARIAEKLAERIASSERRSTQSIDDVGDQLGRVTERLSQRYDRAQSDLADRIKQSEERTAKLLEEAQDKIDARLTEAQRRASLEAAADAARQAVEAEVAAKTPAPQPAAAEPASPFDFVGTVRTLTSDPFAGDPLNVAPPAPQSLVAEPPIATAFAPAPLEPTRPLGESFGMAEELFGALAPAVSAFETPAPASSSTRAMLDQARAAVRQASEKPDSKGRLRNIDAPPAGSVEAPSFDADPSKAFGFGQSKKKKKDGVTLRTALVASGTAAALMVTWAGAELLVSSEVGGAGAGQGSHFGVAPTAVAQNDSPPPAAVTEPADAPATAPPAQAAVALTPPPGAVEGLKVPPAAQPAPPTGAAPKVEPAPKLAAGTLYSTAVRKIESNDPTGVEDLKKAANLGHPAAQFYLAKLYETGGSGLKKDLNEARVWTERAADGGDVAAMHNLGLYYYEGEAGPQNATKAAQWFRKAADQGVKDSQYNLALLYAKGLGVAQNPAEAYKWYLIAAASGDDGAKTAAQAIRAQLTPETQAAAERSAAVFHAQAQGSVRTAATTAATVTP